MDAIRTRLLQRMHAVVLDRDRVSDAVTRPWRDRDIDKLEDDLLQLGFVMSLDLAATLRRLPHDTIVELRTWIVDSLAATLGDARPDVPMYPGEPGNVPSPMTPPYVRRALTWLATRPEHPCPWCGELAVIGALDGCGHLVCRRCWDRSGYAACPICLRRVATASPFLVPTSPDAARVSRHPGRLQLVQLAFDAVETARARFEQLVARTTVLPPDDLAEVESMIDHLGPRAATWLPRRIPVRETMAMVLARLWIVSPDPQAMLAPTAPHLKSATDVLRVAVALMGGDPGLKDPMRLSSMRRSLRRVVLAALDRLPPEASIEDAMRKPALWKRVGERLHPFEEAERFPTAALVFAAVRGTSTTSFAGRFATASASIPQIRIERDRVHVTSFGGVADAALRSGDAPSAAAHLGARPEALLARADHVLRIAQRTGPEAVAAVTTRLRAAAAKALPWHVLKVACHLAARDTAQSRRVFASGREPLASWVAPDARPTLRPEVIAAVVTELRSELVARAERNRHFARALVDLDVRGVPVSIGAPRTGAIANAWPRGSVIPLPVGTRLRVWLDGASSRDVERDTLVVELFDRTWRHTGQHPLDDRTLDLDDVAASGASHAVVVVRRSRAAGARGAEPRSLTIVGDHEAAALRLEIGATRGVRVPITIDVAGRRLHWIDARVPDRASVQRAGGYRAALAHLAGDLLDATRGRPTMWNLACVHASARANIVYVRRADGLARPFRRRDGEPVVARLARIDAAEDADGPWGPLPSTDAPTWCAITRAPEDVALPQGSEGVVVDGRAVPAGFARVALHEVLAQLALGSAGRR